MRLAVALFYPVTMLLFRVRWRGLEHIPKSGGAIIAVNHISYADPIVFGRFIWDAGRVPRYLAKSGLFSAPFPVGRVMKGAGQIPVYRGTASAADALKDAAQALREGKLVLIYPEGTVTRDPDWWPMRGKTGIARLALMVPEAPVIPAGQWGSQQFLDYYRKKLRLLPRKTMSVSAGPAMDLSEYRDRPPTHEVLQTMTDTIMLAVRDQVAALRGEPAPADFYDRPTAQ
jgi:1-acyl-sn-glycerol-3-phosphate acyltransferase